jgi:ADP-ribosylglycohydrolase
VDPSREARLARALVSLEGLSVGDAFGERFFLAPNVAHLIIGQRGLAPPPWRYTDDTQMALSIVEILGQSGEIAQDALAKSFGRHYDTSRGYGPAMHQLLVLIRSRKPWRASARSLFGGQGSFGNGSAMRVAPLGAYFADDLDAVVEQAARSAEVTHAHAEASAGAIAVALAAAEAWSAREAGECPDPQTFITRVAERVPESVVRQGIVLAIGLSPEADVLDAAEALGTGRLVTCPDTVPFTLWCAARHLDNYEEALWTTVSGLGDRDTTCAIVGGIVAGYTGVEGILAEWRETREPLPDWHLPS